MFELPLVASPTERTTAATDAILAAQAGLSAIYLLAIGPSDSLKTALWGGAFGLLALAALLGATVHGFDMPVGPTRLLWGKLYLLLGLVVVLFTTAVALDVWGSGPPVQWTLLLMLGGVLLFFAVAAIWPQGFILFILYQSVALVFALGGYGWLAVTGRLAGAWWMVSGILIMAVAAVVQTQQTISFKVIWTFDHNGAYHLIQSVSLAFLLVGLRVDIVGG